MHASDIRTRAYVHLSDCCTGNATRVCDSERDVHSTILLWLERQGRELERGVRKSITKWELYRHAEHIVISVPRVNPLGFHRWSVAIAIYPFQVASRRISGVKSARLVITLDRIGLVLGPCYCRMTARVCLTQQKARYRSSTLLAGMPHVQHGLDVGIIHPFVDDHWRPYIQHDDSVRIPGCDGFDQAYAYCTQRRNRRLARNSVPSLIIDEHQREGLTFGSSRSILDVAIHTRDGETEAQAGGR